jgi:hypothetical protein
MLFVYTVNISLSICYGSLLKCTDKIRAILHVQAWLDGTVTQGLTNLMYLQDQLHGLFSKFGNVAQLRILTRPGQGSTGEVCSSASFQRARTRECIHKMLCCNLLRSS